jgi:hypothetical protein
VAKAQEEIPANDGWEKSGESKSDQISVASGAFSFYRSQLKVATLQVSQSAKSTQKLPYLGINLAISNTIQIVTFTAFRCANLVPPSFRARNELRAAEDITTGLVPVEMSI